MIFKRIILFIFSIGAVLLHAEFYRLSDLRLTEAKQDSGTIWLENPIPDVRMGPSETKSIDITDVFLINPDSTLITYNFPVSGNNLMVTGNLTYNASTGKLSLDLVSKTVYGSTTMILKADSEFGSVSDTLIVKVDDPDAEFFEWGTSYGFDPQNTLGSPTEEWSAALDFNLGIETYQLNEIEFGYTWDGIVEWKIVPFDIFPGDTPIGDLYGTVDVDGGTPNYIDVGSSAVLTGSFAVVFKTTANFMCMDPAGDSGHTWIYPGQGKDSLWVHPEDISEDYAGAWYIRLFVRNITSGIEEVITTEKTPYLLSNYPNPFNNETVIKWSMNKPGKAVINIFNSKGEFVRDMGGRNYESGYHSVVFNSSGLNSGVYYYQLVIDGKTEISNKMLYLK